MPNGDAIMMGKYNYETRPELSNDQKAYIRKSSECVIQVWIANELAEANRLKRIVIEHQYFSMKLEHGGFGYDKKGLDELLGDKA